MKTIRSIAQDFARICQITEIVRGFSELVAPSICIECQGFALNGWSCTTCTSQVEWWTDQWCPVCANPPNRSHAAGCHSVKLSKPVGTQTKLPWVQARSLATYSGSIRSACLSGKKKHGMWLSEFLTDLWWDLHSAWASKIGPCWIVPIPRHWSRRFLEGHDPSAFLSSKIAQNWSTAGGQSANFLKRSRATPYLSDLYTEERFRVTAQLFQVTKSAVDELARISTVVLVDDILTTGATAISAARALKLAGAKTIYLATMARTLEAES